MKLILLISLLAVVLMCLGHVDAGRQRLCTKNAHGKCVDNVFWARGRGNNQGRLIACSLLTPSRRCQNVGRHCRCRLPRADTFAAEGEAGRYWD
jgi:hypothetical protein